MNPIERVYTVSECRELDRIAIEEHGIPGFELMKRAGEFAFNRLLANFPNTKRIRVVAGSGNNAGDGYVVAGMAHRTGLEVALVQVGDPVRLRGDAKRAWNWMKDQGLDTSNDLSDTPDVVVDGLLGTGVQGSVREPYQEAIADINRARCKTLALDLPSGLDSGTGSVLCDEPIRADLTCTFVGAKIGLFTGAGPDFAGKVELSNLDIPSDVFERVSGLELIDPEESSHYLPRRMTTAHKGQAGSVLVVGGDLGSGGAAILTAEAALRTGAGLVTAISRPEHVAAFLSRCPEVMVHGVREDDDISPLLAKADVVAVGPGLTASPWSISMVASVLNRSPRRLVVDAGALRLLNKQKLPSDCIVTPHPGEAGDLLDLPAQDVQKDRVSAIRELTRSHQCTAILKGAGSLIATRGEPIGLLRCANPALATAGSGDVLTGIVAAVHAVTESPTKTVIKAAVLHCRAGIDVAEEVGNRSIVASDLIHNIRPWEASV